jgi:hypothetical protein
MPPLRRGPHPQDEGVAGEELTACGQKMVGCDAAEHGRGVDPGAERDVTTVAVRINDDPDPVAAKNGQGLPGWLRSTVHSRRTDRSGRRQEQVRWHGELDLGRGDFEQRSGVGVADEDVGGARGTLVGGTVGSDAEVRVARTAQVLEHDVAGSLDDEPRRCGKGGFPVHVRGASGRAWRAQSPAAIGTKRTSSPGQQAAGGLSRRSNRTAGVRPITRQPPGEGAG